MEYSYGMTASHSQSLALTQAMRQSLALLQMPTPDVWEYVQRLAEASPVLEWVAPPWPGGAPPEYGGAQGSDEAQRSGEASEYGGSRGSDEASQYGRSRGSDEAQRSGEAPEYGGSRGSDEAPEYGRSRGSDEAPEYGRSRGRQPQAGPEHRVPSEGRVPPENQVPSEKFRRSEERRGSGEPPLSGERSRSAEALSSRERLRSGEQVWSRERLRSAEQVWSQRRGRSESGWSDARSPSMEQMRSGARSFRHGDSFDWIAGSEETLADRLYSQLAWSHLAGRKRAVAEWLIGCLDERGYLSVSVAEIAAELRAPEEVVLEVLSALRDFEPAGVFASNLVECLQLQLRRLSDQAQDPGRSVVELAEQILQCRLTVRERVNTVREWERLRQASVADGLWDRALRLLCTLDTQPGRGFAPSAPIFVIPEVEISLLGDAVFARLRDGALPLVEIGAAYRSLVRQNGEAAAYLKPYLRDARALVRGLSARRATVWRIAQCVADIQCEFFSRADGQLVPLTHRMVAERLGLHESTVGRAVAGKYALTPRGVFELRYFFPSALEGLTGSVSSRAAQTLLRRLIAHEDGARPLSDSALCRMLGEAGIQCARRTVAKYREELGIPAARLRRFRTGGDGGDGLNRTRDGLDEKIAVRPFS